MYTSNTTHIEMPQTYDQLAWKEFFETLSKQDYEAPLHAIFSAYALVAEDDIEAPPSVYSSLYYDLGSEIISDDLHNARVAALNTGFFQKGVRMVAGAVIAEEGQNPSLTAVARIIFSERTNLGMVSETVASLLEQLLFDSEEEEVVSTKNAKKGSEIYPDRLTAKVVKMLQEEEVNWMNHWTSIFEDEMLADPYAPASILSDFLEKKVGQYCTIYCPLGHEPYKDLAFEMAESEFALEAAKRAGLLATGVNQYVSSALSNEDCWNVMVKGVEYMLNDPMLRSYIPFKERYLAEHLLRMNDAIKDGGIGWWDVYKSCNDQFGDELRGY